MPSFEESLKKLESIVEQLEKERPGSSKTRSSSLRRVSGYIGMPCKQELDARRRQGRNAREATRWIAEA